MRIYTNCHYCNQRFYLQTTFPSRRHMPPSLSIICPFCQYQSYYHPNEINAETGTSTPLVGAALGAIVGGLIGGPVGLLLGGAIGGASGMSSDQQEREIVRRFNEEYI